MNHNPGFFGLPIEAVPTANRATLLSVSRMTPYAEALYASARCAEAPDTLRLASAAVLPGRWDCDLRRPRFALPPVDLGEFATSADPAADRARLAGRVADIIRAGGRPLMIGGDDSVAIPPLLGLDALADSAGGGVV